ncbi:ankyrin repeat-containing domain protein [Xylaria arbuscula]|nr:ankyrin repeat-containing domain protein [Xylaria arbuscula]
MSASCAKPTEGQWLCYKDLIRRWYLVDGMQLDEILTQLSHRGFIVTKNQLHYTMNKKWKIRKNIDENTWVQIDHHINKRKREGKESEVIYCGKRLKPETVKKETGRFRAMGIFAQLASKQSPMPELATDTLISICTPPSLSMEESKWPSTLPWLQFPAKDLRTILNNYMLKTPLNETVELGSLIPFACNRMGQLRTNMTQSGVSKLAAIIGMSIPESHPEEHLQRAQHLLSGSRDEKLYEYLSMVMYSLSNNFHNPQTQKEWQATVAILKSSGLLEVTVYPSGLKSWTIDAFLENLLRAAIKRASLPWTGQQDSTAIVKWLISLDQSRNIANKEIWSMFKMCSSLEAQMRLLELVEHLLETGNDANISISGHSALEIILDPDSGWSNTTVFRMTGLLLKHGAFIHLDQALNLAVQRWDKELIKMIVDHGADLAVEVESRSKFVYRATALSEAARIGLVETRFILELLVSQTSQTRIREYITADVLISAAVSGQLRVLCALCDINGTAVANYYGITPLYAAAYEGHLSICEVLFPIYRTYVSHTTHVFSSLYAASSNHHLEVIQFLIAQGVDVNASIKPIHAIKEADFAARLFQLTGYSNYYRDSLLGDYATISLDGVFNNPIHQASPKVIAACAIMLIKAGAKPSGREVNFAAQWLHRDLLSVSLAAGVKPKSNALQLALMHAYQESRKHDLFEIVTLLLQSGATFRGGELTLAIRIRDQTLIDILLAHGVPLLGGEVAEAIFQKNRHLVDLLLRSGAPLQGGEVMRAIHLREYDLLHLLLKFGTPLSNTDVTDAIFLQDHNLIDLLLKWGAPLSTENVSNAIRVRNYDLVDLLVRSGAPLSTTHLGEAIWTRSCDLVNLLIRSGIPLQGHELVSAMRLKDDALVDLLLEYGGSSSDIDVYGETALEIAIQVYYDFGVTRLFEAMPDSYDVGSLCVAIATRQNSIVQKLVLNRCTKFAKQELEVTAIAMAVELGDLDLLRSLLEQPQSCKCGPLPLIFTASGRFKHLEYHTTPVRAFTWGSPLAVLALKPIQGNSEIEACTQLLNYGFQPDGLTWIVAAAVGNLAFIKILLDNNQRYKTGNIGDGNDYSYEQIPLSYAVRQQNKELVGLLLKAGADVNNRSEPYEFSALQLAAKLGDFEMVRYLVEAGADVNCPPTATLGATALQFAAIKGDLTVAKYLLNNGADVNALPAEENGRTALEGAAEWGQLDMLALLIANGAEKTGKEPQRNFVRAVKRAMKEGYHTAASFLKQTLGWSEEDENLFQNDKSCYIDSWRFMLM